jgi:hypothetical protein
MTHYIYLKLALCGESMIQPMACETALNTALCMFIYEVIKFVQQNT